MWKENKPSERKHHRHRGNAAAESLEGKPHDGTENSKSSVGRRQGLDAVLALVISGALDGEPGSRGATDPLEPEQPLVTLTPVPMPTPAGQSQADGHQVLTQTRL